MNNTLPAVVADGALFDRCAPPSDEKELANLRRSYLLIDKNLRSKEGRRPQQAETDAENLHRIAKMLTDIYQRRIARSPKLAAAIDPDLALTWSRYVELLEMPDYVPPIDTEGRLAAFEEAEAIRLAGGIISADHAGMISATSSLAQLGEANDKELEEIKCRINSRARSVADGQNTADSATIAALHTDEAMAAYGMDAAWIEQKNADIIDPRIIEHLSQNVHKDVLGTSIYNTAHRARESLEMLNGGSENARAVWLDLLNHLHHDDETFRVSSPSDIVRNTKEILNLSGPAWRRLMNMDASTLRKILDAQTPRRGGPRPISIRNNRASRIRMLRNIYRQLTDIVERQAALGTSHYKSVNDLLDNMFATGAKALRKERPWRRFAHLIAEYLRKANLPPAQRGCALPCLSSTLRDLVAHHEKNAQELNVPPMKWHQYIASMDGDIERAHQHAEDDSADALPSPVPEYTDGDTTVSPLQTRQEAENAPYSVRHFALRNYRENRLVFTVSTPMRTMGTIVMADPHGRGHWRVVGAHIQRYSDERDFVIDSVADRLTQKLRQSAKRARRARKEAA